MSDYNVIQIITGVLTGGASAATTFAAVFKGIKRRLDALEKQLGSDTRPKTGIHLMVDRLDENLSTLRKEINRWPDDPPDWLLRLIKRTMASNSLSLDLTGEMERTAEQRHRTLQSQMSRLEEQLDDLRNSLKHRITREEFERDGRKRAEELSKIREQLATVNGLLRGVMTAMGYIDAKPKQR